MTRIKPNDAIGPINHTEFWAKSHEKHFGSVSKPSFPKTLDRQLRNVLNQFDTNFCTAFGEAVSNGFEQSQDFSGEFQTAAESRYLGTPIINGADPYPSMQATTIVGSLPFKLSPFMLGKSSASVIADWNNWKADLFTAALAFKSNLIPYYVDGPYDTFDNIRNALYQASQAGEKGVVKAFGWWFDSWNNQALNPLLKGRLEAPSASEQPISRHRYNFVDFDILEDGTEVLIAVLTQGVNYGDGGILRFDRLTVNQAFMNSSSNGLGLYINRPPKDGWASAINWLKGILAYIASRVNLIKNKPQSVETPPPTPEPVPAPDPSLPPQNNVQAKLYDTAAASLGKMMKLDATVPNLFGCASSLSGVMVAAGITGLPQLGIAGTAALYDWLRKSDQFIQVSQPQAGDIVISPSKAQPDENQLAHGHCGILVKINQGICSNDSDTGKWMEKWTLPDWIAYYTTYGRLPTVYFRARG